MGPPCIEAPGRKPQKIDTGKNEYLYILSRQHSLSLLFFFSSFTRRARSLPDGVYVLRYGYVHIHACALRHWWWVYKAGTTFSNHLLDKKERIKKRKKKSEKHLQQRTHGIPSLSLLLVYPAIHFSFFFASPMRDLSDKMLIFIYLSSCRRHTHHSHAGFFFFFSDVLPFISSAPILYSSLFNNQ